MCQSTTKSSAFSEVHFRAKAKQMQEVMMNAVRGGAEGMGVGSCWLFSLWGLGWRLLWDKIDTGGTQREGRRDSGMDFDWI